MRPGCQRPGAKRKVIGAKFIEVFDEEAHKLEGIEWLAQGTIYPDVIESAGASTGKAHVIKSHHNVGGLPDDMRMSLVEPLRELFKDEVRKIVFELGLPHEMQSIATHSRDRGSACAYSVRSGATMSRNCSLPTTSSSTSCASTTCTTRSARHLRFSCPSNRSV